ncbi:hypothetical protein BTO20_14190 [Mycobacterium dioxanotrophicus]|jgi:hypothetical protein|uniref:Integral membrane protein n=1 Tax=Mycobacterium dioxanotrophicus TaxID=482462 RepID=A0A1Y0C3C8_9MYCO|nr:hypothetical protein [Mycobacterium dioxanotrophicus]ART69586.1 hypothetical protein BTO20_14190 [Mycobacterium dioxanotrophicus]
MPAQPAPRSFSTAFGLLMAAAVAVPADGPALVAAALAATGVLAGLMVRPVSSAAVLAAAAALALSDPAPAYAALAGLSATAYLVIRHAVETPAVVTTTVPSMACAVGFSVVVLTAAMVPLSVRWLPLLVPVAVAVLYVLVVRPFVRESTWGSGRRM